MACEMNDFYMEYGGGIVCSLGSSSTERGKLSKYICPCPCC
jgi:hypothetical protein